MLSLSDRRHALAILIFGVILGLLLGSILTLLAEAAPAAGNRGGCPVQSRRYDLICVVQDAGVGWVSGSCLYGEWFLAQTARTFTPQQPVTATGCVDDKNTLHSAPGFPLRIWKR